MPTKRSRLKELESQMARPNFWDQREKAQEVVRELKSLKGLIEPVEALVRRCEDARALLELAREADDADSFAELDGELLEIQRQLGRL